MFNIEEELKKLPKEPGVYIMRDDKDVILYVGKAVNLHNRVRSYFRDNIGRGPMIDKMVSLIARFEYIVTDSELEALVLENNLIKEHSPKYNTLLKDDKTYPYIKVTLGEAYPRILFSRMMKKDKSKYFGPYTSAAAVKDTIELLNKLYHLRTCNRSLPRDIGQERPCLNYHIKQCDAPCQAYVSQEQYRDQVSRALEFLNGNYGRILNELEAKMRAAAEELDGLVRSVNRDLAEQDELQAQMEEIRELMARHDEADLTDEYRTVESLRLDVASAHDRVKTLESGSRGLPDRLELETIQGRINALASVDRAVAEAKTRMELAVRAFRTAEAALEAHPMAGKEVSGIDNAEAGLFRNTHFIVTPGPHSTPEHLALLRRIAAHCRFGDVIETTPERHDQMIAYTSQLMHVIAVSVCADEGLFSCKGFEGGSFRDCTRVAALDPAMWVQLFSLNAPALTQVVRTLENRMGQYRQAMEAGDVEALRDMLARASDRKKRIDLERARGDDVRPVFRNS